MVRAAALLFHAAFFNAEPAGAIFSARAIPSQFTASIMLLDGDKTVLSFPPRQSAELQERRRRRADLRDRPCAKHLKRTRETF